MKHLCDGCRNASDFIRGCGYADASNIINDCIYASIIGWEGIENNIEMHFFRDNPERSEVYITKCNGFKPVQYEEYMKTDAWNNKRMERIKMDGYKCQLCGSAKNLCVHHITYDRIGCEKMDDLITVCKKCHEKLHEADNARV